MQRTQQDGVLCLLSFCAQEDLCTRGYQRERSLCEGDARAEGIRNVCLKEEDNAAKQAHHFNSKCDADPRGHLRLYRARKRGVKRENNTNTPCGRCLRRDDCLHEPALPGQAPTTGTTREKRTTQNTREQGKGKAERLTRQREVTVLLVLQPNHGK